MTDSVSAPLDLDDASLDDHHDAVIAEAVSIIDGALGRVSGRDMVSSNEVADLLLDVRSLLTQTS